MSFPIQLTDGTIVRVTHKQNGTLVGEDGKLYRPTTSTLRFEPVPTPAPVEEYAPAQVDDGLEVVDPDTEYTFDADGKAVPVADQDMIGSEVENDAPEETEPTADAEPETSPFDLGYDLSESLTESEEAQAEAEDGQIGA